MGRGRRSAPQERGPGRFGGRGRAGAALAVGVAGVVLAAVWLTGNGPGGSGGASGPVAAAGASMSAGAGTAAAVGASASSSPSASAFASPSPSPSAKPTTAPAVAAAGHRVFTVVNALSQTVWVAATADAKHPLAATGWVLAPGQSATISVPDSWGGRIWGRTGCSFDGSGSGHCQTGDCGGRFQCTGSGAIPATLAEIDLNAWDGLDFYDVSMVDGSNLPMYINISHTVTKDPLSAAGCSSGGCTKPVACPSPMQVAAGGATVACETACAAFATDAYCCRGAWAGRANCVPSKWPVDYAAVFKDAEPYAYSYAYDDSATMACKGECDYRITFGISP
jgi:hypothetical protein